MSDAAQIASALRKANDVRYARAVIREKLVAGELSLAQAMRRPAVASMSVLGVLSMQRRWGPARARRVLVRAAVPEATRVRDLTARQREAVLYAVRFDGALPRRLDARQIIDDLRAAS